MAARNPLVIQRSGIGATAVIPAPVGGLNTRDPLDAMDPEDAFKMTNWYVAPDGVRVRRGYSSFRTGVGSGAVETLAEYHAGTTRKLIAVGGGKIYDATIQAPTELASGLTENQVQWAMFDSSMMLVNGADAPALFDGTTASALTVSGPTIATIVGVHVFKRRTYMWTNNSQSFWYGAVNTVAGALTAFPLGRVTTLGGNLLAMSSISVDAGAGPDDFAVFIMTSGDVLVYQGSDPGGSDWALVGVYHMAPPVNIRGVTRWGGDCFVLTRYGIVSIKMLMRGSEDPEKITISRKVQPTLVDATTAAIDQDGLEVTTYGTDGILIVNTPRSASAFDQYVMNLNTGAWGGPWQSMPARCFGQYDGRLFFGGIDGTIWEYTGGNDNGSSITADCETAFNIIGKRGTVKHTNALRPVVTASGTVTTAIVAQHDYVQSAVGTPASILSQSEVWEDVDDDWEDWRVPWGDSAASTGGKWFMARGVGYAVGVRFVAVCNGSCRWESTGVQASQGKGWLA